MQRAAFAPFNEWLQPRLVVQGQVGWAGVALIGRARVEALLGAVLRRPVGVEPAVQVRPEITVYRYGSKRQQVLTMGGADPAEGPEYTTVEADDGGGCPADGCGF